ncbi:MAG: hypothetical protein L0099_00070 [Acidobacteria bacterium]|nr:hypothetical protein [Acidobacteriota bacterium]
MQADSSVELDAESDRLEVPWASADGRARYYDLRRQPELLLNVEEARQNRALGEFLVAVNSAASIFETAKCDAWTSDEISEEERIFGAPWKFGSYVDLIFNEEAPRFSLERHQELAENASRLLRRAPEIPAAAEFVVRRCFFHVQPGLAPGAPPQEGFYLTFYLYGYGDDQPDAQRRWGIALKVVENLLLQLSAIHRQAERRD